MPSAPCPFCNLPPSRIVFSNSLVVALWDGFPVSPGHLLIVPKRHVATWFEANEEEQREIWQAIEKGKETICQLYQPDGFNIGINVGEAAGQTVPHLHLHIIPRYRGDVPDPRGGVRYVIPHKANYLKPTPDSSDNTLVKPELSPTNETVRVQHQHADDLGKITKVVPKSPVKRSADIGDSALVRGERDPLLPHLQYELETATAADLSVAFIQRSGVELLRPYLIDMLQRNGTIRILTGDYMNVTDPDALAELLDLDGPLQLRVFQANAISFHPKAYLFQHADQQGTAFVGSSNLSHSALRSGIEWNYRVYKSTHSDGYQNVREAFEELWRHPQTCTVTPEWIAEYRIRRAAATTIQLSQLADNEQPTTPPQPNAIQVEALAALEECRRAGQQAGLVVLATGLGKTWLSAFDSHRTEFKRILFVAHRDEILQQALRTFRVVRPGARLGKYTGVEKGFDASMLMKLQEGTAAGAAVQGVPRQEPWERGDGDMLMRSSDGKAAEPRGSAFPGGAWKRGDGDELLKSQEGEAAGAAGQGVPRQEPWERGDGDMMMRSSDGKAAEPQDSAFPGGAWKRGELEPWERGEVLFASIQTLGKAAHLKQFAPDAFDYIVVDEFHHAAASTYRRLIDYFTPKFMLGLTATPERSDGGDLLGLCGGNLVFRCDLVRGIQEELLSAFRYFGVPDQVDYAQIPWRSQRFDDEALTAAVATQERARNALELYRQHGARRGLGFCCSMRHADFMAAYFEAQGVRAVAVHSGPTSAPRALSLERLARGELDILFAVDVFNEGLDIPSIDTILMLRPTESAIIWLQQFGRGLRKAVGKDHVRVIDYIGNHKTFLLKVKSLLQPICGMLPTDASLRQAIQRVNQGEIELPAGCEITYDLEAIDILDRLLKRDGQDAIDLWVSDFVEQQGARPQLSELQNAGLNPRALFTKYGSWFGYLEYRHAQQPMYLSGQDVRLIEQYRAWWRELCITAMTKSFKMLVLLGMQHQNAWSRKMSWEELASEFQRLAPRWKGVREEIAVELHDDKALARYVRDNPGKAWGGGEYFVSDREGLQLKLSVADEEAEAFGEMVREVAEWRLLSYLERVDEGRGIRLKLMQAKGRVILKLPGNQRDQLPQGEVVVMIDGEEYVARFAKEYLNVLRRGEENVLSELMRTWFGPRAGERGTMHEVRVWNDGVWRMGR